MRGEWATLARHHWQEGHRLIARAVLARWNSVHNTDLVCPIITFRATLLDGGHYDDCTNAINVSAHLNPTESAVTVLHELAHFICGTDEQHQARWADCVQTLLRWSGLPTDGKWEQERRNAPR